MKGNLRTGFTTGTCAAAGATAGLAAIMNRKAVGEVGVLLPRGDTMNIKLHSCEFGDGWARCSVIKDGGDDPDVTHGAEIVTEVRLEAGAGIAIEGGEGVGTVTKPGLGLEIGGPAINPVPQKMIRENLARAGGGFLSGTGIRVVISVPAGRELAPKTDNPRLGILGGISILGTSGIVVPFSTASFAASIRQSIDVARAMGETRMVLTTGGRSEEFARGVLDLPDHCFVQMGDFAGYAVRQCARSGIEAVTVVGFIGKMAKMAKGVRQTHVKGSKVDVRFLSELARRAGAPEDVVSEVRRANTARHVQEIVQGSGIGGFFGEVTSRVCRHMAKHSEGDIAVSAVLFDFDGTVLSRSGPTASG